MQLELNLKEALQRGHNSQKDQEEFDNLRREIERLSIFESRYIEIQNKLTFLENNPKVVPDEL